MKGSPLLRAFLLACFIGVLSWPLQRLTQSAQETSERAAAVSASRAATAKLPLVLTFSKGAKKIELNHLGVLVWSRVNPSLSETLELNLPFPKEGLELGVSVFWGDEAPAALRLQLTSPDGIELERTVWGNASLETIVPFP
jgi:hypothetical protein